MNLDEEVKDLPFMQKLKTVIEKGKLEYWDNRRNPPNLGKEEFFVTLPRINESQEVKWVKRESEQGEYGLTGEDLCFKFECDIEHVGLEKDVLKRYFIKGYFFEKAKLIGVTIQSFRRV